MNFFDSHCHLEEWMIPEIEASETSLVCNIGCNLKSSKEAIEWTRKKDWIYGTVGIHPEFADQMQDLDAIRILAGEKKIQAIGEIGLDYYWEENPPKEVQRECFASQVEMAKALDMPICIHSREADQETLDLLKDLKSFANIPVLLHCFSGSAELARQYVKLGAWISIAGPVTYKNNRKTIEVVQTVDISRLLIETDSPYLTPVPFRGKPNCPAKVKYTAEKIAEIKGLALEEVACATLENAKTFYRI